MNCLVNDCTVLDMCTGSGLYALRAAANNCKVIGIDISQRAIQMAQVNSKINNIKNVDFRVGNLYAPLKQDEKFDYIIANLPFTSRRNAKKLKGTKYYDVLSIDPEILKEFILRAPLHLKDAGSILFTFGSSGDLDFLFFLISLSPLEPTTLDVIRKPDVGETFYILKLTKNLA